MQVVVTKRDLERVLSRCQGVADKKSTMPVLANVLLETVGGDQLRLAATDLTVAVSGTVGAKIEKPGSVAVGAKDFFERVRAMPEGQISISTNEGYSTTIRSLGGTRRYTLHAIPGEEFPKLPQPPADAEPLTLEVELMSRLINGTYFSIATEEGRAHLSSALFEWDVDRVRMVTTDGHRLSKMEFQVAGRSAEASMLLPRKGVLELRRLCDEARSDSVKDGIDGLTLVQSGPNAIFRIAGFQFSVKLVDAQFPPYQQVIPAPSKQLVRAPRLELMDALRAVKLAASDKTGTVKVSISAGVLRIESESPETGDGFDEVRVEYDGPELLIGFNAQYMLEVLGALSEEDVELSITGELDPAVLRPVADAAGSGDYVAVVMPMRI